MRSHDQGTECRGEGERVHERNAHSHCHRQTELRVECTCGSSHEAHRNEHGHEHECGRNESCGNAFHRVYSGPVCGFVSYVKLRLDRLHHDDGVVHHRSDDEHKGEESDHVETESRHHQEGECADQRHYDRDRRDDGRAKALKEDEHHEDHQEDGLEEGLDHILYGCVEEVLGTHEVYDVQTFREVRTDPLHLGVNRLDDFVRIGS